MQAHQVAQQFGQRPQDQRLGNPFGMQAVQRAHGARNVGRLHGVDQVEGIVTCNVEHGFAHRIRRQHPGRAQQAELGDFLMGGEQVAFDMRGHPFEGCPVGPLLLARQARSDPLRQAVAVHRPHDDDEAGVVDGAKPGAGQLRAIEPGAGDQQPC